MKKTRKIARGFSLIELVIVVVIIAIIGAIAIPKMSRGAAGAADSALVQDLAVMRSALDLYNTEHPTAQITGTGASITNAYITNHLIYCSDANGVASTSATPTAPYIYGPYLKSVPAAPVGTVKGDNTFAVGTTAAGTNGWLFTGSDFKLNDSTSTDAKGATYFSY